MKYCALILFAWAGVLACNNPKPVPVPADTLVPVAAPVVPTREIVVDSLQLPVYNADAFPVKLALAGQFHDGEVVENAASREWTGIFYDKDSGYYAMPARLFTKRVKDEVLDGDNETTGWEITSDKEKKGALLFASKDAAIVEGRVKSVPFPASVETPDAGTRVVHVGDRIPLELDGRHYELFATGNVEAESNIVRNYRLYLSAVIDGKEVKQLIGAVPAFDDLLGMTLIFAGDVDGDGRLDLYLNTSYHYNMMSPTLYLSKPAANGELIKIVGLSVYTGC